jgi:hypothetical protein
LSLDLAGLRPQAAVLLEVRGLPGSVRKLVESVDGLGRLAHLLAVEADHATDGRRRRRAWRGRRFDDQVAHPRLPTSFGAVARTPTGRYHGPAELLLDGEKVADVVIDIHGSAHVMEDGGMGTDQWDGLVLAGPGYDVRDLFVDMLQKTFTLRTPDGRETTAFFRNDRGTLGGSSPFPFDG